MYMCRYGVHLHSHAVTCSTFTYIEYVNVVIANKFRMALKMK